MRPMMRPRKNQDATGTTPCMCKTPFYKNSNPRKDSINREIGFRIRAGVGGTVWKDQKDARRSISSKHTLAAKNPSKSCS